MNWFLKRQSCLLMVLWLGVSIALSQSTSPTSKFIFSTYLGGSGFDEGFSVATDAKGNVYVTGLTLSPAFPGTNSSLTGSEAAFVSKFSPSGELLYSTLLNGHGFTEAFAIAVDPAGNVYITGQTGSADFPIVNGFQTTYGGGFSDAFIAKFDPSGNLIYSSFLGGNSPANEFGHAIAVDTSGNAYIAGTTSALDFPVRNAFQRVYGGGFSDAFVAKINTTIAGSAGLVYSTYLGSFGFDSGNAIALDSSGNAFVGGGAQCCFPTTPDAVQPFNRGNSNAFAAKFSPNGQLLYSTLLGGSTQDVGDGIAVDPKGVVYIVGETQSADFPTTPQAFQLQNHGLFNGFVALIDPSVSGPAGLTYSSYLGGSVFDAAAGVAIDGSGRANITGRTQSADFPTKNALQPAFGGGTDAFVVQLDPSVAGAAGLSYGTFLGGFRDDEATGISLASGQRIAVVGFTDTPFPIANAFQSFPGGGRDAFVTYLTQNTTPPTLTLPSDTVLNAISPAGAIFTFTVTATDPVDPNPTVQCTPPSGSTFAIGTTAITCVATNFNNISASGTFNVRVKGAQEQIGDLAAFVSALNLDNGLTNSLEAKLSAALQDPVPGACGDLNDFIGQVAAKSGTSISSPIAAQLIASASRIKAVLGCR